MSKKSEIDIQVAKKKDLETVLTLVLENAKSRGSEQTYSNTQQAIYTLLKKDNEFGLVWLVQLDKTSIGFAVLTYGYSIAAGGRDAVISELYIDPKHRKPSLELKLLEKIKDQAKRLSIKALHLDYYSHPNVIESKFHKAGFVLLKDFSRLTLAL